MLQKMRWKKSRSKSIRASVWASLVGWDRARPPSAGCSPAFYEPSEGSILIDGVDVRQYDPADLRVGIGFALQDTDLFFGKLRDNIALGKPDATDEEIVAAARLAGVEAFIAGHPLGYDMPIAEGGRSLSGGQKQAIGLARVLIRQPKVLFLDEPTAHFDVRSEADFIERLKVLAARISPSSFRRIGCRY